jgi:hypothetical protein
VYEDEYVTAGTKSGFFTSSWSYINSMSITDQPGVEDIFYSMSFDAPAGGKSYSVFDGSGRREIASSDPAIHGKSGDYSWYFRDNSSSWSNTGIANNYLSAVSMAVSQGVNNQMEAATINSVTEAQWNGSRGFAEGQTRFDMTATLHSTTLGNNPNVSSAVLIVDQEGKEARSIGNDKDYSIQSVDGIKYVNKRNSGETTTTITYR